MFDKNTVLKIAKVSTLSLGLAYGVLSICAKRKKAESTFENDVENKNPLEGKKVIFVENENETENADGVKGHLEAIGDSELKFGLYDIYIKRIIDVILSFGGLVILSPIMGAIALAIRIEDPGPVIFTQKRIGRNKKYFAIHKFRSMRIDTPKDVPTHMLDNPEQYITRVGKFIRAHSLDELPQIWDVFIGNMSVIGPRPALWNQDLLTAERDKYGANNVKPGITGWAQINGRDELEINEKARLDGEYVEKESFGFDLKCFFGTIKKVGKDDSVVEGGTGVLKSRDCDSSWENFEILNNEKPLVSVIIPTYKRSVDLLSRAVISVINQTYDNVEIIVVDDSPNDFEERNSIKQYMQGIESDAIIYHQNESNMGGALARNKGIELARGEYITFLDDDDEYRAEKVEKQLKFMISEGCDLSFSNMIMYNSDGKVVDFREYNDIQCYDNNTLLHYHLTKHMTGTPTFMFRADKIKDIGGFEDAKMGQEFFLMLKAIENNLSIRYLNECDVIVYKHEGEAISSGKNKIRGEQNLYEFKKRYFNELNSNEIKYINFRHWAVMAVAYKRNKMIRKTCSSILRALISSPKYSAREFMNFTKKITNVKKGQ